MNEHVRDLLHVHDQPRLDQPRLDRATLVLALTGWMDGGDVSTGTVRRLVDLLSVRRVAEIDAEPFCIYNFPGSMEIAALFRPPIKIEDGRGQRPGARHLSGDRRGPWRPRVGPERRRPRQRVLGGLSSPLMG